MRNLGIVLALGLVLGAAATPAQATFHQPDFNSMRQFNNLLDKWRHHLSKGAPDHWPQLLEYFEAAYCAQMPGGGYNVVWPDRANYGL